MRIISIFIVIFNFAYISCWSTLHEIILPNKIDKLSWESKKQNVPKFSQLIFSWNAFRPQKGYFNFSVRVRDSVTKKWYRWHKMAQWGKGQTGKLLQRSLLNKSPYGTKFVHVRLELPKYRLADSFEVKIDSQAGAELKNVKRVAVNTVNNRIFKSEMNSCNFWRLPSVYITNVPKKSQMQIDHPKNNELCSPTSTTMLLSYLLKKTIDPKDTAASVYDYGLNAYGSWPFNIAHAFDKSQGKVDFHVERLNSFKDLHKYLMQDLPVIVSVRGKLKGAAKNYPCGHILVVVGYNSRLKKVLCHDPAFLKDRQTLVAYRLKDFLRAWEASHRLAYVASPIPVPNKPL